MFAYFTVIQWNRPGLSLGTDWGYETPGALGSRRAGQACFLVRVASSHLWASPGSLGGLTRHRAPPAVCAGHAVLSCAHTQGPPGPAHPRVAMGAQADPARPFLYPLLGGGRWSGAGTWTIWPANSLRTVFSRSVTAHRWPSSAQAPPSGFVFVCPESAAHTHTHCLPWVTVSPCRRRVGISLLPSCRAKMKG